MKRIKFDNLDEWHEIRRDHVGGSDIGSLFNAWKKSDGSLVYRHLFQEAPKDTIFVGCVSPYKTGVKLWHERAGNVLEENFDNPRTEAGTHLEEGIANWARSRSGWDIRKVEDYLVHETVKGMGASLDYEILDHPKGHTAMDCKETSSWIYRDHWKDGLTLEPPLHIMLQLQHQMACAELGHGVACVYESGVDLHLVDVERNETIINMVTEAVSAFWWHIEKGKAPDIALDFSVASDLYAEADKQIQLDMTHDAEFQKLVDTWDFARQQARRWYEAKDAAFHQILAEVQDASEILLADGGVLDAPTVQRRSKINPGEVSKFRRLSLTNNKGK